MRVLAVACLVLACLSSEALAADIWFTAGVGGGAASQALDNTLIDDMAYVLSISATTGRYAYSVRTTRLGLDEYVGDLALLLERVIDVRSVRVTLGAGPGLVTARRHYGFEPLLAAKYVADAQAEFAYGAGLSWMAELTSTPREPVRAGLQVFGALAEHNHWGVALVLALGAPIQGSTP